MALTCKDLRIVYDGAWNKLKNDTEERLNFLSQLDRTLPDHRFCSGCARYHRRRDASETFPSWFTNQVRTSCGELNVPLLKGMYLSSPMVQLAVRGEHYGSSRYGGDLSTLPHMLQPTVDHREGIMWRHNLTWWQEDGYLMLSVCTFREWHGTRNYRDVMSRGLHFSLERRITRDQRVTTYIVLRRIIEVVSISSWANLASPGWQSPRQGTLPYSPMNMKRACRRDGDLEDEKWYTPFLRAYDPTAGLPGLHWTELSRERAKRQTYEWTRWRWCDETGLPLPDVDSDSE
jgi:hypothetical protein